MPDNGTEIVDVEHKKNEGTDPLNALHWRRFAGRGR